MRSYLLVLSLFFCGISYAQSTITGVITDGKKQPIPGANVIITGDLAGTIADSDGKFILSTSNEKVLSCCCFWFTEKMKEERLRAIPVQACIRRVA